MSERSTAFHMADVRAKRITARRAVAVGELLAGSAFDAIVERRLPKGDAMGMAEVAGLQGAKNAAQLMPLCHPLALEYAELRCVPVPERRAIRVYCEAAAIARTGVEMEALAGASAALLTLYDLSKPVEPALAIGGVRLLFKEGGKKGLWFHPDGMTAEERAHYRPRALPRLEGVPAAVVTLSDRASRGDYLDVSGAVLVERLRALGAETGPAEVRADEAAPLAARLRELAAAGIRLVLCTGGTGLSPRDVTPEALVQLDARRVPGIGELFRAESSQHTPLAWLSRAEAVLLCDMLVIALPGSAKAAAQGMDILAPILAHALAMVTGEGHA
ncbi:bifunctional molybdenum cofactor biosynthesis protein MoaC/MoaB [Rhodanobacter glycinis]|uniref:Bifunctional molybdenum cofactor biosynthesis protein MoaC/MoaB n=1 Tax=Rhodanobacter glycinis TaxID=582702 RepID=A0A5B9E2D3_9GAMM|nr:bifunctional molybdenum cofactor biosynthesis protein MoaC/MoaB [Rhodanobacter glycinis]QEE24831.1 bifunctional molybdenum cofactor biosynthesis protein MoaC/MoaB [Rhodanobacter glycinis]